MFQVKLFLVCFVAICVDLSLSTENDNKPIKVDYDDIFKKETERCRNSVLNRLVVFSDADRNYGVDISNWISPNKETPFLREDALASDVRQGALDDCWFLAVASAILSSGMQKIIQDRFFINSKDSFAGLVIFGNSKIPKCIRVGLTFPSDADKRTLSYGSTYRGQMYAEVLEKIAANEYKSYNSLREGYPEQAHYFLMGTSDCTIYRECISLNGCKIDSHLRDALPRELALKSAITATIYVIDQPKFPSATEIDHVGLRQPHSYALEKIVPFNGRKLPTDTVPQDYTLILVYDQSRVANYKGPFGNTPENRALNPRLAQMYSNLVPGQFYIDFDAFKHYFPVVTACHTPKDEKIVLFKGTFPNQYEEAENMFGYKFEVDKEQNVRIKFELMENIPRYSTGVYVRNYPAVIVIFKLQDNGGYDIDKISCYEPTFSIGLDVKFGEGNYLLIPYSLSPLIPRFYQFKPKYSLKVSLDRSNPVDIKIESTPISITDHWNKFTDYVTSSLTNQISSCIGGQISCAQNYLQLYVKRSQSQEIWIIQNPRDYWLEVQLGLTVNTKSVVAFWRGSDTIDIVPAKTSLIANIIWYQRGYLSDAMPCVISKRVQAGQNRPTKFTFNSKLPEDPPFYKDITAITPRLNPSTCSINVVN